MKHKFVPVFAAFWVVFSQLASGQISPEARAVIDAYNEATGGIEAKKAIRTLIHTGEWELKEQGIKGPMTVYYKHPGTVATVTEIPEVGTIRACITDGVAWEDNSITGFRNLEGTELQQATKDACLFPETKLEELYSKAVLNETRSDGLQPVLLIDKDGLEETWYFDPMTHYLTEIERVLDAGVRGSYRIKVKVGEYLPAGNVTIPHYSETSTPAFTMVTRFEKTEINTGIPDYIFKKPEVE